VGGGDQRNLLRVYLMDLASSPWLLRLSNLQSSTDKRAQSGAPSYRGGGGRVSKTHLTTALFTDGGRRGPGGGLNLLLSLTWSQHFNNLRSYPARLGRECIKNGCDNRGRAGGAVRWRLGGGGIRVSTDQKRLLARSIYGDNVEVLDSLMDCDLGKYLREGGAINPRKICK
jgi:hypothetical protein